ncbi:MAG: hypothetical protein A3H44_08590 [Gammaproteobacteria bacterium RIFCSPLOWO2_02_FULL_57_10]|nr:MAG: hypothetical protein A3H44_08590 [Gammaproteobacteria bacterium RIFCSPLOWO2_02_FULL_57_10]
MGYSWAAMMAARRELVKDQTFRKEIRYLTVACPVEVDIDGKSVYFSAPLTISLLSTSRNHAQ